MCACVCVCFNDPFLFVRSCVCNNNNKKEGKEGYDVMLLVVLFVGVRKYEFSMFYVSLFSFLVLDTGGSAISSAQTVSLCVCVCFNDPFLFVWSCVCNNNKKEGKVGYDVMLLVVLFVGV